MSGPLIDASAITDIDERRLRLAREAFERAGYDAAFIGVVEAIAPQQLDRVRLPAVWWWLRRQKTAASILARLFAYADPIDSTELKSVLPRKVISIFFGAGMLSDSGGQVTSRMRVMPFEGLWLASDEMDAPGDPVMGPGATTVRLARALRVDSGESVLDVGCGAGTLALVAAARGASEVVGVDLLERAVSWSRFNARLNGLEATFLSGDLTAPVAGRSFDVVVSQPPFVIQPGGQPTTTYLHGGRKGDEIALRLLEELDGVLAPTGRALLLYDAPKLPKQTIEERLRGALGDIGARTLVVTAPGHNADLQAIAYSSLRAPLLDEDYCEAVFGVKDHLAELGAEEGLHLLVDVQRTRQGESSLLAVDEVPSLAGWDADGLSAARAGLELALRDDKSLLASSVGLASDAWLVHERALGGSGREKMSIRFESGRNEEFELSDAASVLVDIALRAAKVETIVHEFAKVATTRPDDVREQVLGFLRQSLVSGLLVPQ